MARSKQIIVNHINLCTRIIHSIVKVNNYHACAPSSLVEIGLYEIPDGSTQLSGKSAAAYSSIICECWRINQSENAALAAKSMIA